MAREEEGENKESPEENMIPVMSNVAYELSKLRTEMTVGFGFGGLQSYLSGVMEVKV